MAARITFSITNTPAEDIQRTLRSFAAKVDIEALKPGADVTLGNVRVQVSTPQVNDLRAWARENGYEVGTRGVIADHIKEAFEQAKRDARKAKREAAKARREENAPLALA